MKSYEIEALKKLGVPVRKFGKKDDDYRVKVRSKNGRFVYVSNITKGFYAKQIAKLYPKAFKNIKDPIQKINETINSFKPRFKSWTKNKKKQTYLMERYSMDEVYSKVEEILHDQKKTFKMNLSLGYTLTNIETGDERYWYPSDNTRVFDNPIRINAKADIQSKIIDVIRGADFAANLKYPSSAWKLKEITAFQATINPFDHRLGDEKVIIPDEIKQNKHIVNYPKTENKCIFYCIAGFQNPSKDYRYLKKPMKELFKQYCTFKNIEFTTQFFNSFEGVDLLQFDELEDCFQLRIDVFDMDIESGTIEIKRASVKEFEQKINVLDYKGHAMLITKLDKFEGKHICSKCDQIFNTSRKLADHKHNKCDIKILESFESKPKVYTPQENVLKRLLRKYNIKYVDCYIDHFIVYDFEAILKPIDAGPSDETRYVSEHIPVSVSICDSLTKQVKCIVSDDVNDLLTRMFRYVHKVQSKIKEFNQAKFKTLIDKLEYFKLKSENKKLDKMISQVPLLGFNSGRYDINLIKKELIAILNPKLINSVIKNPSYMCLATDRLKMLDITNYLPAGTNYDSYLKTYLGECKCDNKITCLCGLGKGFFPYEYITSFDKLNETELPPQSAFDSKFKSTRMSDANYERVKFVWSHYNMKTVKDLLIWYNNLDVEPFVKAVIEQREFYKKFGLDMLHDGLSLPGLAEKIMYQVSHSEMKPIKMINREPFEFPQKIFNECRKEDLSIEHLNELLSKQKFSCAFCYGALNEQNLQLINRKGECEDGNVVITCFNCLADRSIMSIADIRHRKKVEYNSDRLVYSIDAENKDIYKKMKDNIAGGPSIIFSRYAESNITKIRGFNNFDAKLCKKVIGYDANALYLWALGNDMPCGRLTTIETYEGIIDDIQSDKLFGFLECDIESPEHLKEYFSEMTPVFKNIEIDPKNKNVIGQHMHEHNLELKKQGKDKKTKSKKLIGSYFGKKILVYTPLLKWYLDHGMVITNMYSFIKASKHQPFKTFADKVSDARREGDQDKSKSMIAEMMKLVGNSAFGRSGMDKSKHKVVKYADEESVDKYTEKSYFIDMDILDGSYEVSMNKREIKLNNPIHLSIAIYQLAKLRMLQFYYDCVDFYFDRSDFQYIEMDTDSAYIAFSDEDPFKNLIKPELRDHFEQHKNEWFPCDDTKENAMYDRRTPGLFKEEWRGNGIYALAAKNYICFNPDDGHKIKISSKGVQGSNDKENKRNADILNPDGFKQIVEEKISLKATNKGFRVDNTRQRIITYEQIKTGLSYYYDKRRVLDDGITTVPLNI